jgi:hypothetical protein
MISERSFSRAFHSFWSELLPLLTPRFVSLFNEAYQKDLSDSSNNLLLPLTISPGAKRPDIIAEFAFRLAQLAHEYNVDLHELRLHKQLVATAQNEAFKLIQKYEGIKSASTDPLSDEELTEGFRLCVRYEALYSAFPSGSDIEFCPKFHGAGFLNSSEGDISIGDTLIEVKTTTRRGSGKDLKQLIVYLALDANTGKKSWTHIGLFNPRRGTFHRAEIDPLILRISGGKPRSDVLAELIAFAESNEVTMDRRF